MFHEDQPVEIFKGSVKLARGIIKTELIKRGLWSLWTWLPIYYYENRDGNIAIKGRIVEGFENQVIRGGFTVNIKTEYKIEEKKR